MFLGLKMYSIDLLSPHCVGFLRRLRFMARFIPGNITCNSFLLLFDFIVFLGYCHPFFFSNKLQNNLKPSLPPKNNLTVTLIVMLLIYELVVEELTS